MDLHLTYEHFEAAIGTHRYHQMLLFMSWSIYTDGTRVSLTFQQIVSSNISMALSKYTKSEYSDFIDAKF